MPVLDLLEGDLAVEFFIKGHEDLAQAPLGMRTKNAKKASSAMVRHLNNSREALMSASNVEAMLRSISPTAGVDEP